MPSIGLHVLHPRNEGKKKSNLPSILLGVLAVSIIVVVFLGFFFVKTIRNMDAPRFLPQSLRNRWPGRSTSRKRQRYERTASGEHENTQYPMPSTAQETLPTRSPTIVHPSVAAIGRGVNRNTSVRSIMTLPEYRPLPKPGVETTIAREGERDGIDVVVEFPETEEESEALREEHMEALYQVRRARAALLERQREMGLSGTRLPPSTVLEVEGLGTLTASNLADLIREREHRISSVSYADLGLARHDGSRISMSSDREALLSSAASMGGASARPSHSRNGSALSISTVAPISSTVTPERRRSEDFFSPPLLNVEIPNSAFDTNNNGARQSQDIARISMPPMYDALSPPPEYESPVATRTPGGRWEREVPELRVTSSTPSINRMSASALPIPSDYQTLAEEAGERRAR